MNALTEVRPPPITLRTKSILLVLTDESGPIGGCVFTGPDFATATLEQCREALAVANPRAAGAVRLLWAEKPADYTPMGCDVLLVQVPGTHELPKRRQRRAPKSHRSGIDMLARGASKSAVARSFIDDPEDRNIGFLDENEKRRESLRASWSTSKPEVKTEPRALDAVKVINVCSCGAQYTEATWAELPIIGAKDIDNENGTITHEDYRNCGCGSTRMVFTTRVKP